MLLSGHRSGVLEFAFSLDSRRAATVSKDGTWRLFDIDVRWELKEDTRLLSTNTYTAEANTVGGGGSALLSVFIHASPSPPLGAHCALARRHRRGRGQRQLHRVLFGRLGQHALSHHRGPFARRAYY